MMMGGITYGHVQRRDWSSSCPHTAMMSERYRPGTSAGDLHPAPAVN